MIFPGTERSGAVKLDIVEYYLAVEDGIMRALNRRPTTLERWPGVHPGIVLSTREKGGGDAFFQKRIPRGAPDYVATARIQFPSGRHADEICPTEVAVVGWAAQMGTITFHPWPVRRDDVDHRTSCASTWTRSRARTSPTPCASPPRHARAGRAWVAPVSRRPREAEVSTSASRRWTFTEIRHAAIAFGRELERRLPGQVTTKWWKEERGERVFVDYNQNARDRTIASAYSVRPRPGAPVSAPVTWDELAEVAPEDFTVATMPARFAGYAIATRRSTRPSTAAAAAGHVRERRCQGRGDVHTRPDYPKMPGEPARAALARSRPPA